MVGWLDGWVFVECLSRMSRIDSVIFAVVVPPAAYMYVLYVDVVEVYLPMDDS